ncbi:MAG: hypothetical protein EU532_01500 [Promethearchaeota archaeon]|nr:MAG: hypothetical protein EU532_01500 [Candidatus Lokiarchaeota archaeon]
MTAQIPDEFIYNNESFSLVGLKGEGLYCPENFGIEPYSRCTSCWRGHVMRYIFANEELILNSMFVNAKNPPKVNCIEPRAFKNEDNPIFDYYYENLNLKSEFTGKILLAKDFIDSMYVHMGFQRPMAYKTVIEIRVENGTIISTSDLSKKMEEYRNVDISKDAQPLSNSHDEIEKWIKKTFSLDY